MRGRGEAAAAASPCRAKALFFGALFERRDNLVRFGSIRVIHIHVRVTNLPVSIDDIRGRKRELPRAVGVILGNVQTAFRVDLSKFIGEGPYDAEPTGDLVPFIAEHGIAETVLFSHRTRLLDALGRDRDDASPDLFDAGQFGLP